MEKENNTTVPLISFKYRLKAINKKDNLITNKNAYKLLNKKELEDIESNIFEKEKNLEIEKIQIFLYPIEKYILDFSKNSIPDLKDKINQTFLSNSEEIKNDMKIGEKFFRLLDIFFQKLDPPESNEFKTEILSENKTPVEIKFEVIFKLSFYITKIPFFPKYEEYLNDEKLRKKINYISTYSFLGKISNGSNEYYLFLIMPYFRETITINKEIANSIFSTILNTNISFNYIDNRTVMEKFIDNDLLTLSNHFYTIEKFGIVPKINANGFSFNNTTGKYNKVARISYSGLDIVGSLNIAQLKKMISFKKRGLGGEIFGDFKIIYTCNNKKIDVEYKKDYILIHSHLSNYLKGWEAVKCVIQRTMEAHNL
ncbi:hypothetical protein X275_01100 [Marinitoga sp. 1197]|uniref:hypothetical protein n=1 Tax=Marinitoga sp. 1197 TaxID=1428449 RepID=UPI000640ED45|nr:hypothetical protein [Marinitoga sp. 1197]AJW76947.1 hypothetical protein UF08_58 [Marinitoga camini virus 1]KLO24026.1 hypothetical protein X275_01100 [Marinitoga sp. 1197]